MAAPVLELDSGFPTGAGYGIYGLSVYGNGDVYNDQILQNITAYGRDAGWTINRGTQQIVTTGFVADAGTFAGTLDNRDRRFDPNHTSGPYTNGGKSVVLPGVKIIHKATFNAIPYNLFTGNAAGWPQMYPNVGIDQTVDLRAADKTATLAGANLAIGRPAELSGARIQAVLDASGYTGPTSISVGQTLIGPLAFSTVSAWSHMTDVVNAELGDLYFAADGTLTFRDRNAIGSDTRSTVSQATFGDQAGELPYSDVLPVDMPIINDVTIRYNDIGSEVRRRDMASQGMPHGIKSLPLTLPLYSSAAATAYGDMILARYAYPKTTFASVTIKAANTPATLWPQALGRELGDRVTIKRTPQGGGSRVIAQCWIRGIQHQYANRAWTTTFYLQDSALLNNVAVYGVNIYGDLSVYGF